MTTDKPVTSIEQADKEIQLAVDLIYLLETNNIETELALKALKIVERDLLNKMEKEKQSG